MIAAADGNPLLAIESARAAGAGRDGPPASLRGVVRAAIAARSPDGARRAAELAAVAGRELDRIELARAAPARRTCWPRMDCGLLRTRRRALRLPPRAAARGRARRPRGRPPRARCTRSWPRARAAAPPRPRATCGSPAATTSPPSASSRPPRDAARATALSTRRPRTCARRSSCARRRRARASSSPPRSPTAGRRRAGEDALRAALELLAPGDAGRGAAHRARGARGTAAPLCDPPDGACRRRGGHRRARARRRRRSDPSSPPRWRSRAWARARSTGPCRRPTQHARSSSTRSRVTTSSRARCEIANAHAASALSAEDGSSEAVAASGRSPDAEARPRPGLQRLGERRVHRRRGGPSRGRALGHADRGGRGRRGLPSLASPTARAARQAARAASGATTRHAHGDRQERVAAARSGDAVARRAGRPRRRAWSPTRRAITAPRRSLLARGLEADAAIIRPHARLRDAEALARLGRADEAEAELRAVDAGAGRRRPTARRCSSRG